MAVQFIKSQQPDCIVAVDNCYGEFTATKEPCAVSLQLEMLSTCLHLRTESCQVLGMIQVILAVSVSCFAPPLLSIHSLEPALKLRQWPVFDA